MRGGLRAESRNYLQQALDSRLSWESFGRPRAWLKWSFLCFIVTVSLWNFVILLDWSEHSSFEIFRPYMSLRIFRLYYNTRTSLSDDKQNLLAEVYCYGCKTSRIAILRVLPPTLESVLQQIRLQSYFSRMVKRATSLFNSFCSKVTNSTSCTFFCQFYRTLKCPSPKIFYFLIWNYTLSK